MSSTMSDPASPEPVEKLRGRVSRGIYAQGTKSERPAVFLECGAKKYVLRRKAGPAYGDTQLEKLEGRTVECDGFIVGTTLLAERIVPVKE
jgi:hypothetical protein